MINNAYEELLCNHRNEEINLSPAYDLHNGNLVNSKDKEDLTQSVYKLIDNSYLSDEFKAEYKAIWTSKISRLL